MTRGGRVLGGCGVGWLGFFLAFFIFKKLVRLRAPCCAGFSCGLADVRELFLALRRCAGCVRFAAAGG